MTIKINVGVNKKIGLPDYGSAGGHCNIEIEADNSILDDAEDFLQRVRDAYLFREATEGEELRSEIRQLVKTKVPKVMTHRFPKRTDEHFTRFFGLVREYMDALDKKIFNYRPSWTCNTMCEHFTVCAC